ncbi:MAG: L-aspartate oxidase [Gammaproteobacteria bacterium]|nr:L-aspartate oxidase [Gammaproteobacteria bacterium]
MQQNNPIDVLVIGSGAAGLSLALQLPSSLSIQVVSKAALSSGSTAWAQGGVSAVLDETDSLQSHIDDTLDAGAGLCDPAVVRQVVEGGPAAIDWLVELGVPFTRDEGGEKLHLTREGGHSHRRVIHASDATGHAIQTTLEEKVHAARHISLREGFLAVDLLTARKLGLGENRVLGAYLLDTASQQVITQPARLVVLATGGASKAYLYTSNPDGATGDGIAMAWRAGCRVANLEFMQFHPTCLYHPKAKSFLLSEALRGEGAVLKLPDGTRFMPDFDSRAELAPRDIVARAIDHEMKRLGEDHVLLDISHQPADFIREHFPTIHQRCLEFGYDITREAVPVVPAAHYTCGGVMTDRQGRTDLPGLYCIGEAAHTGLHGANRMASNSLLECLVYARAAAADISAREKLPELPNDMPAWDESRVTDSDEEVVVSHNWDELRRFMWDYVGIVRTGKRLERALHRVDLLKREIAEYYSNFRVTGDLIELRNLLTVAELIVRSAQSRKESRGLHYTLNHPDIDEAHPPRNTILVPPNFAAAGNAVNWTL